MSCPDVLAAFDNPSSGFSSAAQSVEAFLGEPHDPSVSFSIFPSFSLSVTLTIPFCLSQIVSVPLPASCLPNP